MKFSKAMINAFLFMPVINSQRVTLMESSFHSNIAGWVDEGGEIKNDNKCPDAPCLRLEEKDEIYRSVSTVGYHSIEFSYLLQSKGSAWCYIYYTTTSGNGGWEIAEYRQSVDENTDALFSFKPSDGADDNPYFQIDLYSSGKSCYYNHAKLTGIPITPSPTPAPSYSPTPGPTNKPTSPPTASPTPAPSGSPSDDPTSQPSKSPSDATRNPSETPTTSPSNDPTSDPTLDPTKNPSKSPTRKPTIDPTQEPTEDPTPRSGEVGSEIDATANADDNNLLKSENQSDSSLIYVIFGVLSLLTCLFCGMFFCYYRKNKQRSKMMEAFGVSKQQKSIGSHSAMSTSFHQTYSNYSNADVELQGTGIQMSTNVHSDGYAVTNLQLDEGDSDDSVIDGMEGNDCTEAVDNDILNEVDQGIIGNAVTPMGDVSYSGDDDVMNHLNVPTPNGMKKDSVDEIENENEGNNEFLDDEDGDVVDELQKMTPMNDDNIITNKDDDDFLDQIENEGTDEESEGNDDDDILDEIVTKGGDKEKEEVMTPNPDNEQGMLYGDVDEDTDVDELDIEMDNDDTMQ